MAHPLAALPDRPLDAETIHALNQTDAQLMALPISYYRDEHIYSMLLVTTERASVVGYDGDTWSVLESTGRNTDDSLDPEAVVREWAKETHPDKYDEPAFEVISEDYNLD